MLKIVSSCVQVLTQMNYVGDLQSERVSNSLKQCYQKTAIEHENKMVNALETECQLLHATGSVQLMVARGSSGAGRHSHDTQSQRGQVEIDR